MSKLTDQEILEIGSQQGGYAKLKTDENKERYKKLKENPDLLKKQDSAPKNSEDAPENKESGENTETQEAPKEQLAPDIQKLIQEAVQQETAHLRQQNAELKQDLGVSQDEWRQLTPTKPENKQYTLRKFRKSTDEDWKIMIDGKHLRMEWNEEMRRHNKDIHKITLIDPKTEEITTEEVPYEMFKDNSERAHFEAIEEKKVVLAKSQGRRKRTATTKDGKNVIYWSPSYDGSIAGKQSNEWVDMLVTRDSGTVTLKCLDPEFKGFTLKDFPIEKVNN